MTKLCPRGKAAAKRKFKVYPSAYANAYASKICAGKAKDPSGLRRKDFKGPKPAGKAGGGFIKRRLQLAGPKAVKEIIKEMKKDKFVKRRFKLSGAGKAGGGVIDTTKFTYV